MAGTADFSAELVGMEEEGLLDGTEDFSMFDGYKLVFQMKGMVEAVERPGDTCAVCLAKRGQPKEKEQEVGATCAGMQYVVGKNGTGQVQPWARWIKNK